MPRYPDEYTGSVSFIDQDVRYTFTHSFTSLSNTKRRIHAMFCVRIPIQLQISSIFVGNFKCIVCEHELRQCLQS